MSKSFSITLRFALSALNRVGRLTPLASAMCLALATHAGAQTAPATAADATFVKGRVILLTRAGLPDTALAKIVAAHGGKSRRIGKSDLHVVDLPPGTSEATVRGALAHNPMLKFVELDKRMKIAAVNDPLAGNAWHLANIGAPTAWQTTAGAGITIAILDTGVEASHPDLAAQIVPGWNFADNNSNTSDVAGHGTAVAGAAAATLNNGIGVASVAGFAKIMPIRITDAAGWTTSSTIASGLTWAADKGARVANISVSNMPGDSTIQTAANYMRSKGGLVVVAAGNTGANLNLPDEKAMIVVSATGTSDTIATWSSFGSAVRVAAPGDYILSTDVGGTYNQWWGTSIASPVAAGVVALIMSARPSLTVAQVESVLQSTATDLGAAGRDIYYGYGKVNAAAAVAAALAITSDTTAPTAAVTSPVAGSVVSGLVAIDASAADNVGVARVDLLVDGVLVSSDTTGPYQFTWDSTRVANGSHYLQAVAYDAAGNRGNSGSVVVSVSNAVASDVTPPVVQIINPGNGAKVTGTVSVGINASDNAGAAGLKNTLYIDGVAVATSTGFSLSYNWNTRKIKIGNHAIQAISIDAAGNRSQAAIQVTR